MSSKTSFDVSFANRYFDSAGGSLISIVGIVITAGAAGVTGAAADAGGAGGAGTMIGAATFAGGGAARSEEPIFNPPTIAAPSSAMKSTACTSVFPLRAGLACSGCARGGEGSGAYEVDGGSDALGGSGGGLDAVSGRPLPGTLARGALVVATGFAGASRSSN